MNEQFEQSFIRQKRTLTRFHAQELVLDYVEDRLDAGRRRSMEEYLPKCRHTQETLVAVRTAVKYCERLAQIELSPELMLKVQETKVGWAKTSERLSWRNWPDVMRWSAEAILIAVAFAAVLSLLPMKKIARWLPRPAQEVVLAEVEKANEANEARSQEMLSDEVSLPPIHTPETEPKKELMGPPKPENKIQIKEGLAAAPTSAPTTQKPPPPVTAPAQAKLNTLNLKSSPETSAPESSPAASSIIAENSDLQDGEKGPRGFVYRAFMSSSAVDDTTNSVRELIVSLGGQKAGQVDLGWRKETGTYFHFSLPESNYETLLQALRAHSPVRIYKDPHWRVMPENQIRLILFVEDLSLKK